MNAAPKINVYNEINHLLHGKIYPVLQALGQNIPEFYAHYGRGQRQRVGQARTAAQYEWTKAKEGRKANTELGQAIITLLNQIEETMGIQTASWAMKQVKTVMGAVVARILVKVALRQRVLA